jgi:hypothetical protein
MELVHNADRELNYTLGGEEHVVTVPQQQIQNDSYGNCSMKFVIANMNGFGMFNGTEHTLIHKDNGDGTYGLSLGNQAANATDFDDALNSAYQAQSPLQSRCVDCDNGACYRQGRLLFLPRVHVRGMHVPVGRCGHHTFAVFLKVTRMRCTEQSSSVYNVPPTRWSALPGSMLYLRSGAGFCVIQRDRHN